MAAIVVSEQSVRKLADARSFARGRAYLDAGRVRKLVVDGTTVTAVDGTSAYRVRLAVTRAGLDGTCNCPYGTEGVFCKHCVAAALAWLDGGGERGEPAQQPVPDRGLREFLLGQDTAWLTDELLRAAETDPLLCARLAVAAGAQAYDAYDDRALRTRLERAIEIRDFVEYGAAYSYFRDVDEALTEVAGLIDQGFADTAMNLAEYALELLEEAAERVDDSDGGLRGAIGRAAPPPTPPTRSRFCWPRRTRRSATRTGARIRSLQGCWWKRARCSGAATVRRASNPIYARCARRTTPRRPAVAFIIAGEQLQCHEVTRGSDRHEESGQHLEGLRSRDDLGLDSGGGEKDIYHDAKPIGAWTDHPCGRQSANGVLLDDGIKTVPRAGERSDQSLSSGIAIDENGHVDVTGEPGFGPR